MSDDPPNAVGALLAGLGVCAALLAGGCGDDVGDRGVDGARAPAGLVPEGAAAVAGGVQISKDRVDRLVRELRWAHGGGSPQLLRTAAMTSLLREAWLEQEAGRRGVDVAEMGVMRRLRRLRRRFGRVPAARDALRGTAASAAALRLRTQLLGQRLDGRIRARADDPDAALERFRQEFRRRWRSQTVCLAAYEAPSCGELVR